MLPAAAGKAMVLTCSPLVNLVEHTGHTWGLPGTPLSSSPFFLLFFRENPPEKKGDSRPKNMVKPNQSSTMPATTSANTCKNNTINPHDYLNTKRSDKL